MRTPWILQLICLFILSSLVGCASEKESNTGDLTVFRYNESKGITTLDPAYARNQTIIWPVSQIFNGLVQLDDSLNVQAAIAHSWEISRDGTLYTFYLRCSILFSELRGIIGVTL